MNNTNTGGTAFPMQDPQAIHAYAMAKSAGITDTDQKDAAYMAARAEAVGGMTLRDYFAAKAMQTLLGSEYTSNHALREGWMTSLAHESYMVADAMLRAREGGAT